MTGRNENLNSSASAGNRWEITMAADQRWRRSEQPNDWTRFLCK